MSGDALEQALALHRSPLQRFTVRELPLPQNIDVVIQLATGSQPLLRDTAERLCEPEAKILEAVRFYLQQVLFEPGTDAYRILAVAADAPHKRIHEHYRWLQRWLHPDRCSEDWDSVFASRLNWAWQQLRTETARVAYDAKRAPKPDTRLRAWVARPARVGGGWTDMPIPRPPPPRGRWLRRGALGVSFGSCFVLLYLAITHEIRPPSGAAPVVMSAPDSRVDDTAPQSHVAPGPTVMTPVRPTDAVFSTAPEPHISAAPPPAGDATRTAQPAASMQADSVRAALAAGAAARIDEKPLEADVTRAPTPETVATHLLPVSPRRLPDHAEPSPPTARNAKAGLATRDAGDAAHAAGQATTTSGVSTIIAPQPAPPDGQQQPESSARLVAKAVVPAHAAPAAEPGPIGGPLPPGDSAAMGAGEMVGRINAARRRISDIVAYFRRADAFVPDWQDTRGLHDVEQQRIALRARNGDQALAAFALDPPVWRLSATAVSLEATYHVRRSLRVAESGHFMVDMVWGGDAWRITRLDVEPER